MNRHTFLLLYAALLALSGSRPAGAQALLQRCDKAMAVAEASADQVGTCAVYLKNARSAPAPLTEIPADIKKEAMTEPLLSRLIEYYSLSAYLAGDLGLCEPLDLIGGAYQTQACRRIAMKGPTGKELFGTNEEFTARCLQDARGGQKESAQQDKVSHADTPSRMAKLCPKIAESRFGPVDCSKWVPLLVPDAQNCRAFFALFNGDATACRGFKADGASGCSDAADCHQKRDGCLDLVAYGKAYRAKDIAQCGTSNFCRVLMGDKDVPAKLAAKLTSPAGLWFMRGTWKTLIGQKGLPPAALTPVPAAPYAGALPPGFVCVDPLGTDANGKAAHAAVGTARLCLSDIELAISRLDLETARGLDAREEKLARLGMRLDASLGFADAAKAPKPPVKRPN